jgi:sec-independent protein translocase protein TatA
MGALQPLHLAFVALVALLAFGPKRLPDLARGLGEALREFKHSMEHVGHEEPDEQTPDAGR